MVSNHLGNYEKAILECLKNAFEQNSPTIAACAKVIEDAILSDGIIHTFGSGHSSAVAFELFHRAGGLACVNLLANHAISPFAGRQSGRMEKLTGVATAICASHEFRKSDVGFVVSNSGKNAVPVEVAQLFKLHGMKVIGVLSLSHANAVQAEHKLQNFCDYILDTTVAAGDALIDGGATPYGPASTIIGSALVNAVICSVIEMLRDRNYPDIVLRSQNLPGADETNQILRDRYRQRVRLY